MFDFTVDFIIYKTTFVKYKKIIKNLKKKILSKIPCVILDG